MELFNYNSSSSAELKRHITTNANISLASIRPHLEEAETMFLPVLGITTDLVNQIKALTPTQGSLDYKIRYYMQKVVANYALYLYLPDNGFQVGDTENKNENQVPNEKLFNKKLYATLRKAYNALEYLVYKLLLPNYSLYPFFNTDEHTLILHSPLAFRQHQHLNADGGLELHIALRTYMQKVEDSLIQKLLCKELFKQIKTKKTNDLLNTGTLSSEEKELMRLIGEIIAEESIKMASPYLNNLLTINGHKATNRPNEQNSTPTGMQDIHTEMHKNSTQAVKNLIEYLTENIDVFTEWETCRSNPKYKPENPNPYKPKNLIQTAKSAVAI